MPNIRFTFLGIVLFCTLAMLIAVLYFQNALYLMPCPLCVSQRVFMIAAGIAALLAFIHNPKALGVRVYAALVMVSAVIGGSVSTRQLWLQGLPEDQIPSCGPTLDWMLEANFPLAEVLRAMFLGEGSCAEVKWQLFGISIPGWTLIAFIFIFAVGLWQFLRAKK